MVSQRRWCPVCESEVGEIHFGHRHSIRELKDYAEAFGGECLSDSYDGMRDPLGWICSKDHKWTTPAVSVISNNRWCPECAVERRSTSFTIQDMRQIARERGGDCLSEEYHGLQGKLT